MLRFDTAETQKFWQEACGACGLDPATPHHAGTFAEPVRPERAAFIDELAQMAADGRKHGTAHMLAQFEHDGIPLRLEGDCWIVTTIAGAPLCVVRITDVAVTPYEEVGEEFAACEGEGDLTVRYWRGAHLNYFKAQCLKWDLEWHDRQPIVCEQFELIYPA